MKFIYATLFAGIRTSVHTLITLFTPFMSLLLPVAARAAGLDTGTTELSEIRVWMYSCLGIIVAGWLIWRALQCLADKRPWMDFFIGFGIAAAVGGVVVGSDFAFTRWGSL